MNRSFYTITLLFLSITVNSQTKDISNEEILALFKELRVADVSDALDIIGLQDRCIMDQSIEPLWKDITDMSHVVRGIAVTARYVPTNEIIKTHDGQENFNTWKSNWYRTISRAPFDSVMFDGAILVMDVQGDGDTGSVGSANSLRWVSKGMRGVVSNGGIRDIDEIMVQKIPVYLELENRGRGIRPGRNELESVNRPVSVGGVLVNAGDVIVADGDGVVVVPRAYAKEVSKYATEIIKGDKEVRKRLYEQIGMPLDDTVR